MLAANTERKEGSLNTFVTELSIIGKSLKDYHGTRKVHGAVAHRFPTLTRQLDIYRQSDWYLPD